MKQENSPPQDDRPPINWFRLLWSGLLGFLCFGVLAAIFYPILTPMRPAYRSACLSNLKQITTACFIYSSDFDDRMPLDYSFDGETKQLAFMNVLQPYTKNLALFKCGELEHNLKNSKALKPAEGIPGKMDYVHCLTLRTLIPQFSEGKRVLDLAKINDPANAAFLRDAIAGYGVAKGYSNASFLSPHGSGFSTSYLDGHTKVKNNVNINTDL